MGASCQAWSDCVDAERDSGRDFTEECSSQTVQLQACMQQHKAYYRDLLYEQADAPGSAQEAVHSEDGQPPQAEQLEAQALEVMHQKAAEQSDDKSQPASGVPVGPSLLHSFTGASRATCCIGHAAALLMAISIVF